MAEYRDGRRAELGGFLRNRRSQLIRADVGLPAVGRGTRRLVGLRREEVATLSGVSVTWYTWLEQGRDIHPSQQVLTAVARALQLSSAERDYILSLAGYTPLRGECPAPVSTPDHLQVLVDSMGDYPAFVLAPDWSILGWNNAYAVLYPNVKTVAPTDRNLLWLLFTDPCVRELLPNWSIDVCRFLAEFRAESGSHPSDERMAFVVDRLLATSGPFKRWWADYNVHRFESRERLFHHPAVGDLVLEHHLLMPVDRPDLRVVLYLPSQDGSTPTRLASLIASKRS